MKASDASALCIAVERIGQLEKENKMQQTAIEQYKQQLTHQEQQQQPPPLLEKWSSKLVESLQRRVTELEMEKKLEEQHQAAAGAAAATVTSTTTITDLRKELHMLKEENAFLNGYLRVWKEDFEAEAKDRKKCQDTITKLRSMFAKLETANEEYVKQYRLQRQELQKHLDSLPPPTPQVQQQRSMFSPLPFHRSSQVDVCDSGSNITRKSPPPLSKSAFTEFRFRPPLDCTLEPPRSKSQLLSSNTNSANKKRPYNTGCTGFTAGLAYRGQSWTCKRCFNFNEQDNVSCKQCDLPWNHFESL